MKRSMVHSLWMRNAWISLLGVSLISSFGVSQPWHCLLETLFSVSFPTYLCWCICSYLSDFPTLITLSGSTLISSFYVAFLIVSLWILLSMCLIRGELCLVMVDYSQKSQFTVIHSHSSCSSFTTLMSCYCHYFCVLVTLLLSYLICIF